MPLPLDEGAKVIRKIGGTGHRGCTDHHRDHDHVAIEKRPDFDANPVRGIVQSAAAVLVGAGKPGPADDDHRNLTAVNRLLENALEDLPALDAVHIVEDGVVEARAEMIA